MANENPGRIADTGAARDAERQKPEERPVTLGEVQAMVNGLVQALANVFATKNDLNAFAGRNDARYMEILRKYPAREEVATIAKDAVPKTLRHLDEGNSQRQGDTLMLSPGGADGGDSAYWGTAKAGVPRGSAEYPNLVWNSTSNRWEAGIPGSTNPDGTEALPHLIWNHDTERWEIGLISEVPDGTAGAPHLIWNAGTGAWEAGEIETDCLPSGGTQYQVLQRVAGGDAGWDWTRWAIEVT